MCPNRLAFKPGMPATFTPAPVRDASSVPVRTRRLSRASQAGTTTPRVLRVLASAPDSCSEPVRRLAAPRARTTIPRVLRVLAAASTKMAGSKCGCSRLARSGRTLGGAAIGCCRVPVEAVGFGPEGDAEVTRGFLQGRGGARRLEVTGGIPCRGDPPRPPLQDSPPSSGMPGPRSRCWSRPSPSGASL